MRAKKPTAKKTVKVKKVKKEPLTQECIMCWSDTDCSAEVLETETVLHQHLTSFCRLIHLPTEPYVEYFLQANVSFCSNCSQLLEKLHQQINHLLCIQRELVHIKNAIRTEFLFPTKATVHHRRVRRRFREKIGGIPVLSAEIIRSQVVQELELDKTYGVDLTRLLERYVKPDEDNRFRGGGETRFKPEPAMNISAEVKDGKKDEHLIPLDNNTMEGISDLGFSESQQNQETIVNFKNSKQDQSESESEESSSVSSDSDIDVIPPPPCIKPVVEVIDLVLEDISNCPQTMGNMGIEDGEGLTMNLEREGTSNIVENEEIGEPSTNPTLPEPDVKKVKNVKRLYCPWPECDESVSAKKSGNMNMHRRLKHRELIKPKGKACYCLCQQRFKSKTALTSHIREIHADKNLFVCGVCNENCSSETVLKEHMKIHPRLNIYSCRHCSAELPTRVELKHHKKTNHKPPAKSVEKTSLSELKSLFWCDQCFHPFKSKRILRTHKVKEHSVFWECRICEKSFKRQRALLVHENKTGHNQSKQDITDSTKIRGPSTSNTADTAFQSTSSLGLLNF